MIGLQDKGVEIEVIGEVKYPNTRPFKKYAIKTPLTKQKMNIEIVNNIAVRTYETVAI
jgi:hypothetical protein